MELNDIVAISAVRTAMGKFGGTLKDIPAFTIFFDYLSAGSGSQNFGRSARRHESSHSVGISADFL